MDSFLSLCSASFRKAYGIFDEADTCVACEAEKQNAFDKRWHIREMHRPSVMLMSSVALYKIHRSVVFVGALLRIFSYRVGKCRGKNAGLFLRANTGLSFYIRWGKWSHWHECKSHMWCRVMPYQEAKISFTCWREMTSLFFCVKIAEDPVILSAPEGIFVPCKEKHKQNQTSWCSDYVMLTLL